MKLMKNYEDPQSHGEPMILSLETSRQAEARPDDNPPEPTDGDNIQGQRGLLGRPEPCHAAIRPLGCLIRWRDNQETSAARRPATNIFINFHFHEESRLT